MENGVLIAIIASVVAIFGALIATVFVMKNADEANKANHDRMNQAEKTKNNKEE